MHNGCSTPPQVIPQKKEILEFLILMMSTLGPQQGGLNPIVELLRGKNEGVVVVEDHQAMEAIVLSDIAGSDGISPLYPAEDVLRCPEKRLAQRIPLALSNDRLKKDATTNRGLWSLVAMP
jgi:hypothetical protein